MNDQISTHQSRKPLGDSQGRQANGNVSKRLQSELMSLMMSAPPGISAFPVSDEDMLDWAGTITGVEGTPYEGLTFKIRMTFPTEYPFKSPTVSFTTPCFHPNISLEGGICLDILQDKWSSVYTAQTVLISLQSMLGDPNNASPLNVEAADMWEDQAKFKKQVLAHYKPIDM